MKDFLMVCLSTERVIAGPDVSATEGQVRWAPAKSLWVGGMTLVALGLGPAFVTPGAIALLLVTSAVTLCLGHYIGLVGMAGPLGMVRLHDMRDWAQRQGACHDLHAHRAPAPLDAWWQMHCQLVLGRPPRFAMDARLREDRFLRWLEATWMLQQAPLGVLFFLLGGMPWLVWGIAVRVAVSVTGHWVVGHITHRRGPQGWVVDGVAVQGHDLPAAAVITFGEAWHGNHHAWPGSARFGLEKGQADPGWWVLVALRWVGLVHALREPGDFVPREGLRRVGVGSPAASRPSSRASNAPL
jgi:hypothetical protein